MSDFSELIKNFDSIRDSLRNFFIFGHVKRSGITTKSTRSYDNELRRIKSWLKDIVKCDTSINGKSFCISVNPSAVNTNPLYSAFKSKSFTDKDVILHFFLLDVLATKELTLNEISDIAVSTFNTAEIETQTIRNKLKEYAELGIVKIRKSNKTFNYSLADTKLNQLIEKSSNIKQAISFFSEMAHLPVAGHFILNRLNDVSNHFCYKHYFMASCLDEIILLELLDAIKKDSEVIITNYSERLKKTFEMKLFPIKIFVSTRTGRRYLIGAHPNFNKLTTLRLDYIKSVEQAEKCAEAESYRKILKDSLAHSFGTTVLKYGKTEHFEMLLNIDEEKEQFILERLKRESRGGTIEKINPNTFLYSVDVFDTTDMMPWVKSFIGRIIKVSGDNQLVTNRFYSDIERLVKLYEN